MKRMKKFLIVLLLITGMFMSVTPMVKADSGWDSDYDSGGSWDSGSDWSSGSSWDNDYDYDYSGGSSSDLGGFGTLVIIIIIFVFIALKSRRGTLSSSSRAYRPAISDMYNDITQEHLSTVMPGNTLSTLKTMAYDNFVQIQNAWMNFDYDKLRELCTDELYNSYVAQLETLKLKNGKNIMNGFDKNSVKIIDVDEVNGDIILTVFMSVAFYDYVINVSNNSVTRGSNSRKISNNYILTYVVRADYNSEENTKCPNCGAPIEHVTSGECEYCHSTIVKRASKFVLSKKTNVNK